MRVRRQASGPTLAAESGRTSFDDSQARRGVDISLKALRPIGKRCPCHGQFARSCAAALALDDQLQLQDARERWRAHRKPRVSPRHEGHTGSARQRDWRSTRSTELMSRRRHGPSARSSRPETRAKVGDVRCSTPSRAAPRPCWVPSPPPPPIPSHTLAAALHLVRPLLCHQLDRLHTIRSALLCRRAVTPASFNLVRPPR